MTVSQADRSGYVRYASVHELIAAARYEWSARKAWRSRRAALRGLRWWLIRNYACELCQDCGRPVGTVCTGCFVERAEELGVFVHVEVVAGV